MVHFGVICPAAIGHSNPMVALAGELMQRGHRCTFFQVADWEKEMRKRGAHFQLIGAQEFPLGAWLALLERLGATEGLESLKLTIQMYCRVQEIICRDVPPAARRLGIDAFLVDQSQSAGTTVAEYLGVPAVTLCMAMLLNQDPDIPPPVTPWQYRPVWWARLRNQAGYSAFDRLAAPIRTALNDQRRHWGLPRVASFEQTCSPLAQISQQPREFEFPRTRLPKTFHFCGPLRGATPVLEGELAEFVSSGSPFVYGSLGTIQNYKKDLFRTMAEVCASLDLRLVLAHAGALDERESRSLPGNTLAVRWAQQPTILEGAALCITHCGMNTVLDALSQGVPCIGIPMAHEQPAIARRLEWTGSGINLGSGALTAEVLRAGIERVLSDPGFSKAARHLQVAIAAAGGVSRAADICEQVASSRRGVSSVG